jgi:hypothetical protein
MSTFTVDTVTLEALQSTISALYEELSGMHRMAPSFSGALGGSDLEGEVSHFLSAWHSGVALIEGDMQKVVQRLGAAAAAYGQSETFISAASCG